MAREQTRDDDFEEPVEGTDFEDTYDDEESDVLEDVEIDAGQPSVERPRGAPRQASRPPFRRRGTEGRGGPPGRRMPRRLKKACQFCEDGTKVIDYKRTDILQRFITERGNIRSRRKVGTCAKHQRQLAVAIKRARLLALLPFTADHIRGA